MKIKILEDQIKLMKKRASEELFSAMHKTGNEFRSPETITLPVIEDIVGIAILEMTILQLKAMNKDIQ